MNRRDQLIDQYISDLKEVLGADTDAELARRLSVDKRTVSAWRARKSIPKRFLDLLQGEASAETATPAMQMTEIERSAFALALFRFARAQANVSKNGDFRQAWNAFHSPLGFWVLMRDASHDLRNAMKDRADNIQTALALVMHDDVESGEEGVSRWRSVIEAVSVKQRDGTSD